MVTDQKVFENEIVTAKSAVANIVFSASIRAEINNRALARQTGAATLEIDGPGGTITFKHHP